MEFHSHLARYNRRIRQMKSRFAMLARLSRKASLSLACLFLGLSLAAPSLRASNLDTAARQLADRIASTTGPGSITLEVANRSSLDDKSAKEVRSAIQAELRIKGVHAVAADQSVGSVNVILSESLREFVWTAVIAIGADPPRTVLVSSPRPPAAPFAPAFPLTLKKTLLFSNEQPILDAALIDASGGMLAEGVATIPAGARLLVLEPARVVVYRQQSGHWDLETSLPINVSRVFPRDVRGRLFLRRDHLFDAYLPGAFCRSSSAAPLTMNLRPQRRSLAAHLRRNRSQRSPRLLCARAQLFHRRAFARHRQNFQRALVLFCRAPRTLQLHALGSGYGRWLHPRNRRCYRSGHPLSAFWKRPRRHSLHVWRGHAASRFGKRRLRS